MSCWQYNKLHKSTCSNRNIPLRDTGRHLLKICNCYAHNYEFLLNQLICIHFLLFFSLSFFFFFFFLLLQRKVLFRLCSFISLFFLYKIIGIKVGFFFILFTSCTVVPHSTCTKVVLSAMHLYIKFPLLLQLQHV